MAAPFRILVTGSRGWSDRLAVARALNAVCDERGLNYDPDEYGNTMPDPSKVVVVHGDCPTGADHWADQWALGALLDAERHPADWTRGKGAGYARNAAMVALGADLCLVFGLECRLPAPRCKRSERHLSHGTEHCMGLATAAGIPVQVIRP